jgi:hypothetical protein
VIGRGPHILGPHGRPLRRAFAPHLPIDRGNVSTAAGGSIVLLESCDWCKARRELTPRRRLERMAELSIDALNLVLEPAPRRPNNCCPYHWDHFMRLRTEEGQAALRALAGT